MINPFKSVNFIYQDTHSENSMFFIYNLFLSKIKSKPEPKENLLPYVQFSRISLLNASNSKINICSFFAVVVVVEEIALIIRKISRALIIKCREGKIVHKKLLVRASKIDLFFVIFVRYSQMKK